MARTETELMGRTVNMAITTTKNNVKTTTSVGLDLTDDNVSVRVPSSLVSAWDKEAARLGGEFVDYLWTFSRDKGTIKSIKAALVAICS